MDTQNQSTPETISVLADKWKLAANEAKEWAKFALRLAEQRESIIGTMSAKDSERAARFAHAAVEAIGGKATELRKSSVEAAKLAATQAELVISDLNEAVNRAKSDGKMNAAGLMQAHAQTWLKAMEIADKLSNLSEQIQAQEQSAKGNKKKGDNPIREKKWWKFWK
jgi:hypothetical protein